MARTAAAGDRACLNGVLFVLLTGIRWTDLPALLLAELHAGDQIDWTRAAVDASHVRAKGEDAIGPGAVPNVGEERSAVDFGQARSSVG